MLIRHRRTGKIVEWEHGPSYKLGREYTSLADFFNDWEDYNADFHKAEILTKIRTIMINGKIQPYEKEWLEQAIEFINGLCHRHESFAEEYGGMTVGDIMLLNDKEKENV